jgi:nucleotide-binding universal stress UspA family protein
MRDFHSAATVVVGVDGSPAAVGAAVWAVDEAAGRDIPLKLVYVIYRADLPGTDVSCGTGELAAARTALSDARRTVEATAELVQKPVKIETEVLRGNPLATLIELSRSAPMMCVGSIGIGCACHRAGSTAAALSGSARCPVAVIRRSDVRPPDPPAVSSGRIVAEADTSPDNNAVLQWAMAEARLRDAPLRVISASPADSDSAVQAQLNRRIDRWARLYPDVAVESVAVHGSVAKYLADNAESVQLFVAGNRDRRSLGWPDDARGCSVLTVVGTHL